MAALSAACATPPGNEYNIIVWKFAYNMSTKPLNNDIYSIMLHDQSILLAILHIFVNVFIIFSGQIYMQIKCFKTIEFL